MVERYGDLVYKVAITNVKHKQDAEDIFQKVFISLMHKLSDIQDEAHLKHLLIRSTLNHAKNHHLSFWKKRVDFKESLDEIEHSGALPPAVLAVRSEILSLKPKLREVVFLHYYEGYSIEEVGAILEVPSGTVKSRLHTARGLLKSRLEEQNEFKPC